MRRCGSVLLPVLALAAASPALAHSFTITEALLVVRTDGRYQLDLTVDVDALALGVPSSTDSAEVVARLEALSPAERELALEGAAQTITRRVRLRADGSIVAPADVVFPGPDPGAAAPYPTVLGTTARIVGVLPEGTREITFFASRAFGPVQLTILGEATLAGTRTLLEPGEESPPWVLRGEPERTEAKPVIGRYVALGFEHIVPLGVDHILFVLGLFLLGNRLGPLLWQVSAFTVAHTVTLALSIYGVVSLPSRLVETAIALSIAWIAAENVITKRMMPWRPAVVFCFGLLHGLGFAGVLSKLGLPAGERLTALLSFNVGVELGQLSVIGLAFVLLGWFRGRSWYRSRIVVPLSSAIGLVGLFWAFERALG